MSRNHHEHDNPTPGNNIEAILTQYKECYAYLREHDMFIWHMSSVIVTLFAGIVIAAYRFIPNELRPIRIALFSIGLFILFSLWYAMIKHRFFAIIEQLTLTSIEKELQKRGLVKLIQRRTRPDHEYERYWAYKEPNFISKFSAHKLMIGATSLVIFIFVIILLYPFFMHLHLFWILCLRLV